MFQPVNTIITPSHRFRTALHTQPERLTFSDIRLADLPVINRMLQIAPSRTCDYTIGGIFMWIKYFHYQYCIFRNTLFVKGVSESDISRVAFSLPIGSLPLSESLRLIDDYCRHEGLPVRFSAIPFDRLDEFMALRNWHVEELTDWADYLYDIQTLSTLSGNKMAKKRNHVNRFIADNPGWAIHEIHVSDEAMIREAYLGWSSLPDSSTSAEERGMTLEVLRNLSSYPFEGAWLADGCGRIVAFTFGEVIGDTLYVHIEKMDHSVAGAGETVNKMFAAMMARRYPQLRYVNREEDCGDESLRFAKQSYHPVAILRKFDLTL